MKIGSSPPQDSSRPAGKSTQSTKQQSSAAVSPAQASLQVGDLIKGKVLSVGPQGMVTIESLVGQFSAKSLADLLVGDKILLEIVKTGENPLVTIASGKSQQIQKRLSGAAGLDQVAIQGAELFKSKVVSVESKGLVTIEPAKSHLSAKPLATLSAGDTVLLKIIRAGNTSLMSTSSEPQQLNPKQSSGPVYPSQAVIQVGDVVKGTVTSVGSQGVVDIESAVGRFSAKSPVTVTVGDRIFVEIVKGGDKPVVNIVADQSLHLKPKQALGTTASFNQSESQIGGFVKGTVVSVDPKGLVTIESAAGRFSAHSFTALSVGDQIFVELVKAGDNFPESAIRGNPPQGKGPVFDMLRVLMPWLKPGNTTNFQGLLSDFQTVPQGTESDVQSSAKNTRDDQLLQFLTKNATGAVPDSLQQVKIAALSSSLKSGESLPGILQKVLGISGGGGLDEVSHPELKKMAQLFETHGALNSKDGQAAPQIQSSQSSDLWLFPCFFVNGEGAGEWMFSFEQNESAENEKAYTVAFYLTMSRLGDVHLQLIFDKSSITGVFALESDTAVQHMRNQIDELQETLQSLFGKAVFTCYTASEKSIEKLKSDLQQKSGHPTFALLDVSA